MNTDKKKAILKKAKSYIRDIVFGKKLVFDSLLFDPSLLYDNGLCYIFPKLTPIWRAMIRKLGGNQCSCLPVLAAAKYEFDGYFSRSYDSRRKFNIPYRSGILALILALPYDDLIVWMDSIKVDWEKLEKKINKAI
jgi:hypothetical protein